VYDVYYLVLYFFIQQSFFFQKSAQNFNNVLSESTHSHVKFETSVPTTLNFKKELKPYRLNDQVQFIFKTNKSLNFTSFNLANKSENAVSHLLPQNSINLTTNFLTTINATNYVLSNQLNPHFANNMNFSTQHNSTSIRFLQKNPYMHSYLTSQLLNSTKQYRWLTKNFLNTSQLTRNSHKVTQSKFLISNNLLDTDKLQQNI